MIITGHVLAALQKLPAGSVDCVVTSPPYYGLRSYKTEPQLWPDGWVGNLGEESTWQLYIKPLMLRPPWSYNNSPNSRLPLDTYPLLVIPCVSNPPSNLNKRKERNTVTVTTCSHQK